MFIDFNASLLNLFYLLEDQITESQKEKERETLEGKEGGKSSIH